MTKKKEQDENKNIENKADENINIEDMSVAQMQAALKEYAKKEENFNAQAAEIAKKIEEVKKAAEDYKDKWIRSVAEFDNYKKRTLSTRSQAFDEGKTAIITKVLSIGDNLERALSFGVDDKTKEGLMMLLKGFNETLEKEGVTVINPVGEKFDPTLHEAVMQVEAGEGETSGNVKDVFLKGYKLGDKVIRYAQVRVIG